MLYVIKSQIADDAARHARVQGFFHRIVVRLAVAAVSTVIAALVALALIGEQK